MKLAYWMYAGPAHIGTLRVASSFKNVHAIMHAPLGDDYFNVMRSMLERERDFTPVTASIVDRHVLARGSQEKVVENITRKNKEESPDLVLLTPTCTSSILQEDLHNFVERSTLALTSISPNPPATKTSVSELSLGTAHSPLPLDEKGSNEVTQQPALKRGHFETDVILADVNHYRVNELQAADRTLEQIVRFYLEKAKKQNNLDKTKTENPSVNIIGIFTLGFHNQHDCRELKRLFNDLGITINEIIPEGGSVHNLKNLPKAWFNFVPYREVGLMTAVYLFKEFQMPYISTTPMGLVDTSLCIREMGNIIESIKNAQLADQPLTPAGNSHSSANFEEKSLSTRFTCVSPSGIPTQNYTRDNNSFDAKLPLASARIEQNKATRSIANSGIGSPVGQGTQLNKYERYIDEQTRFISQAAWFARSIDCQNLTGKKAVVFGDATHSAAMTKILAREMGIRVSCAGTYCKHDADWFREQVSGFCDQILITDDHTQVGDMIALLEPAAIFGTQMERHVGKRLDIPCGVISAPVHIQNFPLGYRPFLGYEGANQIADLVYNSFSLGMEDHLLQIFGGHDTSRDVTSTHAGTPAQNPGVMSSEVSGNNSLHSKAQTPAESGGMTHVNMSAGADTVTWSQDGLTELNKVPGFVRGKVKRNTEKYALQNQINVITMEVMYAAKEAMAA